MNDRLSNVVSIDYLLARFPGVLKMADITISLGAGLHVIGIQVQPEGFKVVVSSFE